MDLQGLLDLARSGDPTAWNNLLGMLRPEVRARLLKELTLAEDASEVANDVLMRAHTGTFRGSSIAQFRAWVRSIARNAVIDHWRKLPPQQAPLPDVAGDDHSSPDNKAVRLEQTRQLLRAVEELPQPYRSTIHQRFFENLNTQEIAELTGEDEAVVRQRCYRAIKMLRKKLAGEAD